MATNDAPSSAERSTTYPDNPVNSPPSASTRGASQLKRTDPGASSSATADRFNGDPGPTASANTAAPTKPDSPALPPRRHRRHPVEIPRPRRHARIHVADLPRGERRALHSRQARVARVRARRAIHVVALQIALLAGLPRQPDPANLPLRPQTQRRRDACRLHPHPRRTRPRVARAVEPRHRISIAAQLLQPPVHVAAHLRPHRVDHRERRSLLRRAQHHVPRQPRQLPAVGVQPGRIPRQTHRPRCILLRHRRQVQRRPRTHRVGQHRRPHETRQPALPPRRHRRHPVEIPRPRRHARIHVADLPRGERCPLHSRQTFVARVRARRAIHVVALQIALLAGLPRQPDPANLPLRPQTPRRRDACRLHPHPRRTRPRVARLVEARHRISIAAQLLQPPVHVAVHPPPTPCRWPRTTPPPPPSAAPRTPDNPVSSPPSASNRGASQPQAHRPPVHPPPPPPTSSTGTPDPPRRPTPPPPRNPTARSPAATSPPLPGRNTAPPDATLEST